MCGNPKCSDLGQKQLGLHLMFHSRYSQVWEFFRKAAWAAESASPTPSTPLGIHVKTSLGCRKGFAHAKHTSWNFCRKLAWDAERVSPTPTTALGIPVKTSPGCRKGFAHTNHSFGNSCKNQPGLQKGARPHQPQLWSFLWKPA